MTLSGQSPVSGNQESKEITPLKAALLGLSMALFVLGIALQVVLIRHFPNTGLGLIFSVPEGLVLSLGIAIAFYFLGRELKKWWVILGIFFAGVLLLSWCATSGHPQASGKEIRPGDFLRGVVEGPPRKTNSSCEVRLALGGERELVRGIALSDPSDGGMYRELWFDPSAAEPSFVLPVGSYRIELLAQEGRKMRVEPPSTEIFCLAGSQWILNLDVQELPEPP